jgi:hypothetical protein
MKRFVLSASAIALMAGAALAAPAEAASWRHGWHHLSPAERVAIRHSQHRLDLIRAGAYRDGRVTFWERAKIRLAQSRHNALVNRLSHN